VCSSKALDLEVHSSNLSSVSLLCRLRGYSRSPCRLGNLAYAAVFLLDLEGYWVSFSVGAPTVLSGILLFSSVPSGTSMEVY
jgi:hypothetical protein